MINDEMWSSLSDGPVYAEFPSPPMNVWVVDHACFAYAALETRPFVDFTGLVWARYEATYVSQDGAGIRVDFKRGVTGWFPRGNASFNEPNTSAN